MFHVHRSFFMPGPSFFSQRTRAVLLAGLCILVWSTHARAWEIIEPGIQLKTFNLTLDPAEEQHEINILRIDPAHYDFRLIAADRQQQRTATLKEWSGQEGLTGAINASMYREDRQQSTGYMKTGGHLNNGYINPRFGAFLVFDPKNPSLPQIQIVDRSYQDWKYLIGQYDTVIQNFRLISIKQENLWPRTDKKHSIAAVGMDKQGRVLFMHSQVPMSIHDFNTAILGLPIDIFNAMYVEGGPEAAMYLKTATREHSWQGRHEHLLLETFNQKLWPVPNVIGIVPKHHGSDHSGTDPTGDLPCK